VLTSTSAQGRPTTYGYDAAGQLTSVAQRVDPAVAGTAITVSVGYDAAGNKTRLVDGRGNATIYTYNTWNLPESVIEPSTTPTRTRPTGPGPPSTTPAASPPSRCCRAA
jgi:uncharacterized protein RhaS with RHS repeats